MKPSTELTDRIFQAEQEETSITVRIHYKEKYFIEHVFKEFTYDIDFDEDAEESISVTLYWENNEITITDADNIDSYDEDNNLFQVWNNNVIIVLAF